MAELCVGAEKHETFRRAANYRLEDVFTHVDEAIAMAVMYVANHLNVRAIIALTESGSTPLWMSRVRSDIPVFAFTRHEATSRRVSMYRGVYAVPFDIAGTEAQTVDKVFDDAAARRRGRGPGDLVLFTKGDQQGVSGRTNTMQILTVPGAPRARRAECLTRRARRSFCPAPVPAAHTRSVFSKRSRRCCRKTRRIRSR